MACYLDEKYLAGNNCPPELRDAKFPDPKEFITARQQLWNLREFALHPPVLGSLDKYIHSLEWTNPDQLGALIRGTDKVISHTIAMLPESVPDRYHFLALFNTVVFLEYSPHREAAEQMYERLIPIARAMENNFLLSVLLVDVGNIYNELQDPSEAERHYTEAVAVAEKGEFAHDPLLLAAYSHFLECSMCLAQEEPFTDSHRDEMKKWVRALTGVLNHPDSKDVAVQTNTAALQSLELMSIATHMLESEGKTKPGRSEKLHAKLAHNAAITKSRRPLPRALNRLAIYHTHNGKIGEAIGQHLLAHELLRHDTDPESQALAQRTLNRIMKLIESSGTSEAGESVPAEK